MPTYFIKLSSLDIIISNVWNDLKLPHITLDIVTNIHDYSYSINNIHLKPRYNLDYATQEYSDYIIIPPNEINISKGKNTFGILPPV